MKLPDDLPGASDIIAWFGYFPVFHDGYVLDIDLKPREVSSLRIHGFNMTDETDEKGYFILDRHAVVTIRFAEIRDVSLTQFRHVGIIGEMKFSQVGPYVKVEWRSAYGVEGAICAKRVWFEIEPGKPAPD